MKRYSNWYLLGSVPRIASVSLRVLLPVFLSVFLSSAACTGTIGSAQSAGQNSGNVGGDGSGSGGNGNGSGNHNGGNAGTGGGTVAEDCGQRTLPIQPLRRLSTTQYQNTIRDLFGETLGRPLINGSVFPQTLYGIGFESDAEPNIVNTSSSNAIEDNGERIGKLVLAGADSYLRGLMTCTLPATITDAAIDGCVDTFIRDFGLRAFRRPVTAGETTIARGLYDGLRTTQSAREAWATVVQFLVESPALLYRVERGAGASPVSGLVKVSDYEMASRLSYFFTNTMPDKELFAEAAAGRLSTPDQIRTQAQRLMGTPGFWEAFGGFHRDWLQLAPLATATKDAARFPEFTADVQQAMTEETGRLVRHVLEDGDGSLKSLLATTNRPLNGPLAAFYGQAAPGADATTWVNVDVANRRGLLTEAALMAVTAHADNTSVPHRGAFFQREVLCNMVPALPGNVDTQGPLMSTANLPTARERLAPLLAKGSTCVGCHTLINPTGFAMENYDAAGRWRDKENNATIDASGSMDIDDMTVAFDSPMKWADLVASGAQTQDCYGLQMYRASMGHREYAEDACSIQGLRQAGAASGGDIRQILLAVTQTDGFLFRREQQ